MEYSSEQEKLIDDGEDDGWVDTHHYAEKSAEEKVSEMTLEEKEDNKTQSPSHLLQSQHDSPLDSSSQLNYFYR